MRKLYYYPICPLSRQVRVYLRELDLTFSLIKEDYWQRNASFVKINPAGTLPVLEEETGLIVCGIYPILEYLREQYPNFHFMSTEIETNCEIRRIHDWCNHKFYREVTKLLIDEKVIRLFTNSGSIRPEFIRIAKHNLNFHLNYLTTLLESRVFIAGDNLSAADIIAACHLSVVDYFGEIHWEKWSEIKHWYSIIKSRPSFRALLQDQIPGFTAPHNYAELDF